MQGLASVAKQMLDSNDDKENDNDNLAVFWGECRYAGGQHFRASVLKQLQADEHYYLAPSHSHFEGTHTIHFWYNSEGLLCCKTHGVIRHLLEVA